MNKFKAAGEMFFAVLLVFSAVPLALANNMVVTNVAVVNQNREDRTVEVKFDLKWDNSWRAPCSDPAYTNWDAAWVFVKFRAPNSSTWEHAKLSVQNTDHTPAEGSMIEVGTTGTDGVGAFVYSSGPYTGAVYYAGTRLKWNYGASGYDFPMGSPIDLSVAAIEMVYVPQGSFYVGSGGTESGSLTDGSWTSGATIPYPISSEAPINIDNSAGCLWGTINSGITSSIGGTGTLSAEYPKGYHAFYCMKYEITQGQYCGFLNKLSLGQAANRWSASVAGYRYTISTNSVGVFTNAAPDRACNYLSRSDAAAYAAWAGLRPMTELEFEKACRGPANPAANEYAWGTTTVTQLRTENGTPGSGTETPGTLTGANCCEGWSTTMLGPTRVGIFATASSSTRQAAGASYWGIMELSGNVNERCVTVGNANGRNFKGSLGSGMLDATTGAATNSDWFVDSMRGGNWSSTTPLRVSDRAQGTYVDGSRYNTSGFRAVRPAP